MVNQEYNLAIDEQIIVKELENNINTLHSFNSVIQEVLLNNDKNQGYFGLGNSGKFDSLGTFGFGNVGNSGFSSVGMSSFAHPGQESLFSSSGNVGISSSGCAGISNFGIVWLEFGGNEVRAQEFQAGLSPGGGVPLPALHNRRQSNKHQQEKKRIVIISR